MTLSEYSRHHRHITARFHLLVSGGNTANKNKKQKKTNNERPSVKKYSSIILKPEKISTKKK